MIDDAAFRQFIQMTFLYALPDIVGGVIVILALLSVLVYFHEMLPDKEYLDDQQRPSNRPQ